MESNRPVLDLSSIEKIQKELHKEIAETVADNLYSFSFGSFHRNNDTDSSYAILSPDLYKIIFVEIKNFLNDHCQYTPAQKSILKNSFMTGFRSTERLKLFSQLIAGE